MTDRSTWRDDAARLLAGHRHEILMMLKSGVMLDFQEGFIPRLVSYTHEDKAAKGLRSLKARNREPEPPIHYSALEMIQENRCTLLMAGAGGGKTSFGRHLALNLAGDVAGDAVFGRRQLATMLSRNSFGDARADAWGADMTLPAMVTAADGLGFEAIAAASGATFQALLDVCAEGKDTPSPLVIIDDVERVGRGWAVFTKEIEKALSLHDRLCVVLLGDGETLKTWPMPACIARFELLPFLEPQRLLFAADVLAPKGLALGKAALAAAAARPALFALAQRLDEVELTAEGILDAWSRLEASEGREPQSRNRFVADLLTARHLADRPMAEAAALFEGSPQRAKAVLASLINRLSGNPVLLAELAGHLLACAGDAGLRGALLAAEVHEQLPSMAPRIVAALLEIVENGRLTVLERVQAGCALAARGDPRELEALAEVSGGAFVMGSAMHPNSSPPHIATVGSFRIGIYPVTNAVYRAFIEATGRPWASRDGLLPARTNAPAVDVTWHDARAFCTWLTNEWRAAGRIGQKDIVRLPTEVEWERAARGDQPDEGDSVVYPWQGEWADDIANSETVGFNAACTVGLFPKGRSPFGSHDMAGQVWEWCSTLWGEDMAQPSYTYPYRDDGREDGNAPDNCRRVLRGGCFSSGPTKACATYRGSLEANGFWRGNGFRIAVSLR